MVISANATTFRVTITTAFSALGLTMESVTAACVSASQAGKAPIARVATPPTPAKLLVSQLFR